MKMERNRFSIACDIDGVLANFEQEFVEAFGDQNRHIYNLYERVPASQKELVEEFLYNPAVYQDLEPIFGGLHLVSGTKQRGYGVVLITSRPKEVMEATEEWLDRYSVDYDHLIFSPNKGEVIDKWNKSRKSPIFCLVDDSMEVLKSVNSEIKRLAWSQEWNHGYFPRMKYDQVSMKLLCRNDSVSDWETFWKD